MNKSAFVIVVGAAFLAGRRIQKVKDFQEFREVITNAVEEFANDPTGAKARRGGEHPKSFHEYVAFKSKEPRISYGNSVSRHPEGSRLLYSAHGDGEDVVVEFDQTADYLEDPFGRTKKIDINKSYGKRGQKDA